MAWELTPKQSLDIKVEDADHGASPDYTQLYPLLANKNEEELKALNKSVLKKLDWKFLPCITAMLLMK
jgi:hypothetical protein